MMRGIDQQITGQVTHAIGNINQRLTDPVTSRHSVEIFKLELIKKMLTSELLDNRIQGIRELNDNIIENSEYEARNWSVSNLIDWFTENGLFAAIWDPK